MEPSPNPLWLSALEASTREGLSTLSVLPTPDGVVALKRADGSFAVLAEDDLLAGIMRLVDRTTGAVATYPDVDALLDAGWALD